MGMPARNLLLALPGLATLAFFFFLPLGAILAEGFLEGGLVRLLDRADLLASLASSLILSLQAAAISLIVGLCVALHLAQMSPRMRVLLQIVIALPLTFSGLIVAYGFILVFGRAGFVTLLLAEFGIPPADFARFIYSRAGLTLAYSYYLIPRVILMLLPVFVNFDRRQLDAAESLGAPRWRALFDIMAPQVLPTAMVSFCLVAAVAFGAYGTALALVGTQIDILPLRLYSMIADTGSDFPLAAAVSLLLLATCSLIMAVAEVFAVHKENIRVRV